MPATPALIKRAKGIERGIRERAQEHAWSHDRWSTRKGYLVWASVFATGAAGTAIATALTDEAKIAWLATVFAILAGAVTTYEKRVDPSTLAAEHQHARNEFELLLSDFLTFIELEAPSASADDAQRRFDELMHQRAELIKSSVGVERAARIALGRGPNPIRAARQA